MSDSDTAADPAGAEISDSGSRNESASAASPEEIAPENDSIETAVADDAAAALATAAVTNHTRKVTIDTQGDTATMTWRDYGNGYIQLKSGNCSSVRWSTCKYVLRADGGRTTFASWGPFPSGFASFVNGKYTIAKSRHPYVKVFINWGPAVGTFTGYVHLY